jgi:hypothetical protein
MIHCVCSQKNRHLLRVLLWLFLQTRIYWSLAHYSPSNKHHLLVDLFLSEYHFCSLWICFPGDFLLNSTVAGVSFCSQYDLSYFITFVLNTTMDALWLCSGQLLHYDLCSQDGLCCLMTFVLKTAFVDWCCSMGTRHLLLTKVIIQQNIALRAKVINQQRLFLRFSNLCSLDDFRWFLLNICLYHWLLRLNATPI